MTKEIGCSRCPYAGHIELKECPDANTEVSQYCGMYEHEPIEKDGYSMNNKEVIRLIKEIKPILYGSYKDAFDYAIKAIETVDKIKQAIDKNNFPEYLEEEVIDIIDAYYRDEKPLIKTELSKYPLCNARDEALCCEMTEGGFCSFAGNCPNKGRRIRKKVRG